MITRRGFLQSITAALAAVVLPSCSQDLPKPQLPDKLLMSRQDDKGREIDRQVIDRSHPVHRELQALLDRERSGWQRNTTAVVEAGYVFRSPTVIVRCFRNKIIVNYPSASFEKKVEGAYLALGGR